MENHIDWAGDVAWLTDGVTSCLTERRTLARRNRRAKACVPVVCLPRSGWSWTGGYADMPTRSWPDGLKPIDPNGTTGPWRPTGHRPTTIMASITPWPMPQPMAQGRP